MLLSSPPDMVHSPPLRSTTVPHRPVVAASPHVLLVTRIVPAEADCRFKGTPAALTCAKPCAALNDFQFSVCAEQFGFYASDPPSCRRCRRCRHRNRCCRLNHLRCHRVSAVVTGITAVDAVIRSAVTGILIAGCRYRRAAVRIAVIFFIVVVIILSTPMLPESYLLSIF